MGLISIYPFCLKWICKNDSHIHINNKHNNIVHIRAFSIHPWVAEIPKYADRAGVCPIDWRYLNMWLCQVIWSKNCLNKKKRSRNNNSPSVKPILTSGLVTDTDVNLGTIFPSGWWLTYPSEKWWSSSVGKIKKCSKPPTSHYTLW